MGSDESYGNNGAFEFAPAAGRPYPLRAIASDGAGWEHVSVSTAVRVPTWAEMCFIKGVFWDGEDVVIQFHPRELEYVNCHPNCLHLWRPVGVELPAPPSELVGPR